MRFNQGNGQEYLDVDFRGEKRLHNIGLVRLDKHWGKIEYTALGLKGSDCLGNFSQGARDDQVRLDVLN